MVCGILPIVQLLPPTGVTLEQFIYHRVKIHNYNSYLHYRLIFVGCTNNGPLGMISGDIEDWQISASSSYPSEWDKGCSVKYARPYLENSLGWCARFKTQSEWLQIDLGVVSTVSIE